MYSQEHTHFCQNRGPACILGVAKVLLWHGEGQPQLFKCLDIFLRYLGQVTEGSGSMQQPTTHPTMPHPPPGTHPFLPKSGSSLVLLAHQTCCCDMVNAFHSCSSVWISSLGIWARPERLLVACSNPLRIPPCSIHRQERTLFFLILLAYFLWLNNLYV